MPDTWMFCKKLFIQCSQEYEFRICTNFQPVPNCHVCTLVAIGVFLLKNNFDWNKFFLMKNMWWIAHLFYFFLIEFALWKVHFRVGSHERFEYFLFWKNGWKFAFFFENSNTSFLKKTKLIRLFVNWLTIWNSFFVKTYGEQLMISFFFLLNWICTLKSPFLGGLPWIFSSYLLFFVHQKWVCPSLFAFDHTSFFQP